MRHYGELKYEQENCLQNQEKCIVKVIYRPTSVYGYVGPGQRMGLIPTLISNGIQNRPSTIYGDSSTLRDYVFNENIGAYIVKNLFNASSKRKINVHLLASGKPSSIFEIQNFVEQVIGKKIYLNFHSTAETENTRDITVNSSALPADWSPTDIKIGIRYVKDMLISGNSIKLPKQNR
jgi:nucleoside-diphosphate-sugar epimerase